MAELTIDTFKLEPFPDGPTHIVLLGDGQAVEVHTETGRMKGFWFDPSITTALLEKMRSEYEQR